MVKTTPTLFCSIATELATHKEFLILHLYTSWEVVYSYKNSYVATEVTMDT